jgi:hypothetical protein
MAGSQGKAESIPNSMSAATEGSASTAIVLALVILLCSLSCGLMLLLDPRTLAVDSVYQEF